jgi:hypothetical protein
MKLVVPSPFADIQVGNNGRRQCGTELSIEPPEFLKNSGMENYNFPARFLSRKRFCCQRKECSYGLWIITGRLLVWVNTCVFPNWPN